jgi:phage-related protein
MRRPVVWIADINTAGLGKDGRRETAGLIDDLQEGILLRLPHSRPMPSIGERCHELRIRELGHRWRILYHLGYGEIVILSMFDKKQRKTPKREIQLAKRRLRLYQRSSQGRSIQ